MAAYALSPAGNKFKRLSKLTLHLRNTYLYPTTVRKN